MSRIDKRAATQAHSTRSTSTRAPSKAATGAQSFFSDGMGTSQDAARRTAAQHAVGATSRQGQDVAVAFEAKIAQLQRAIANDTPGAREELANVIRDRDGVAAAIADIEKKLAANEDPATWANVTPKSRARAEQADTRAQLQKQLQDLKVFGLKVAKMNPTERQNLQNFFRLAKEDPEAFKRFVEGNKPGAQPAPAPTQGPAPVNTTPTGAPANIQAAIDFGLTQLGAPYVGGASPYRFGTPGDGRTYQMEGQHAYVSPKGVIGYDCSGLMVTMLKKAGIDLSGMASSRGMLKLPEVPKDQLQPGDLLVKNGHVAMYIGNGQMIESVPGGVRVAPASKYIYDPAYSGRHPG